MSGPRPAPAGFAGDWLGPGEPGYDRSRAIWNGMHDRRPRQVARCRTAADVAAVLRWARAAGLPVTVRGGGHNVAGTAVADGAVLIDLSPMRAVSVDPATRTGRAGGGCLLGDLDRATAAVGLVCPAGIISHTGLGGLTLGGGYGWLSRRLGLTCDHLVGAEVVLADGSTVTADGDRHPDLFWALRGGGGNFGVVTRLDLRLRPAVPVYRHDGVYDLDDAVAALAAFRALRRELGPDLHAAAALKVPGAYPGRDGWLPAGLRGRPALVLSALWFGPPAAGPAATEPLFRAAPPAGATAGPTTYLRLQCGGDHERPAGSRYFTKSTYLRDLTPELAAGLVASARAVPSPLTSINLEPLGGAIAAVPDEESAFPGRGAPWIVTSSSQWTDRAGDAANQVWTRRSISRLAPGRYGGGYVNYLQDEEDGKVAEVYGAARYHRLATVKRTYDPDNVFRANQNIPPAPDPAAEGRG
jgi:FAD/FMN-containing dehydrogenase